MKTKIVGAAGRFGARYGQHIKRRIAKIEDKQRKKQVCPFCEGTVKRLATGIWSCKRCHKKFAGHAYFLEKGAMTVKIDKEIPVKKQKAKSKTLKEGSDSKKQAKEKKTSTKAKSTTKSTTKKK